VKSKPRFSVETDAIMPWEINEIKIIKQKLKVKNTRKFNKTCGDLQM